MASLWKGIVPGLHRQCIYGGLRIGLYEPVKDLYVGKDHVGDVPLTKKILAALTTGALGITVANPTDLVKVRLQAEGKLPPGAPRRYSGALDAYSKIVRQEGVVKLWTGLGPNIARNAIINAAELASYDQVKQTILKIPGFTDNVVTHLFSGLGAGFFAVCIGSPVDVVFQLIYFSDNSILFHQFGFAGNLYMKFSDIMNCNRYCSSSNLYGSVHPFEFAGLLFGKFSELVNLSWLKLGFN
ncbi:hypothetical protein Leryth_011650 [Lithospermum erythrorhizon]|nr:hypothetical protein Leryth_011650 [Lithospermum erythrorhizon]